MDLASAVAVLQEFVRHHATSASAATAADVAREAVPAGWMPPPPPWTPSSILVEAIDEGLATATQFLDAGRGETDAVTTLRQSIRLAAGLLGH